MKILQQSSYWIFLVSLLVIPFAHSQNMVQINPIKDNTLYENNDGDLSNGAGEHLFAGRTNAGDIRRALLAFDIAAALPADATVDNVKLTLNMSKTISGNAVIELRRLLSDWGEGSSDAPGEEGSGTSAQIGDATWIHTFFNTEFWNNAGGDFSAGASASQSVGNPGTYEWGSTPEMVADVQNWLEKPDSNFGWLLLGNESQFPTAKRFDSRENSNIASQPLLTIYYTGTTGIEDNKPITGNFQLYQNYPNPFNPSTTITFFLDSAGEVRLSVYNVLGMEIRTLIEKHVSPGNHKVEFDAANLPGGIYFYRLLFNGKARVRPMILLN